MSSELLDLDLPDKAHQDAKIIHDCAEHLLAILCDILELARIKSDKFNIKCLPFSLPAEINKVVNLFSASAEKKGLSLSVNVQSGLKTERMGKLLQLNIPIIIECLTVLTLAGDSVRLRQVLFNLISNSIKVISPLLCLCSALYLVSVY